MKLGRKDKAPEAVDVAVSPGDMDARTNGDRAASDRNGKRSTQEETPTRSRRGRHAASTETVDIETQPPMLDLDADEAIADLVVARVLADASQLSEARIHQAQSGERLGDILVHTGVLGERELVDVLGEVFGMPVVDIRRENPEPEAIALVPEEITRRFKVVPLRLEANVLKVGVADRPTDELRTLLAQASEHGVEFVLAPE